MPWQWVKRRQAYSRFIPCKARMPVVRLVGFNPSMTEKVIEKDYVTCHLLEGHEGHHKTIYGGKPYLFRPSS